MKKAILGMFVILAALGVLSISCKQRVNEQPEQKKLRVVASLFPLYDFAKAIGGEHAEVTLLLPPGIEAHAFEPTPGDIVRVDNADVFLYIGRQMEPWAEDVLKGIRGKRLVVIDASSGIRLHEGAGVHDHGPDGKERAHGRLDPHIWLDFALAQQMVDNILRGLLAADPGRRDFYRQQAGLFKSKLGALDEKYRAVISSCRKHTFVHGGHYALGYLARRYDLEYISAYKGSPDAEPTPKQLIELREAVTRHGIRYIYFEELISPRIAGIIADETGATILQLHGAHNVTKNELRSGVTFLSIMEKNLENLSAGLECG